MIKQLYQSLLEAGFSEKEIFDKLKKKNDEYQGFMSKEAILVLIAKESGLHVKLSDTDIDIYGVSDDEVDYDPYISDQVFKQLDVTRLNSVEQLFQSCRIISIHAANTSETYHVVDKNILSRLETGGIIVTV